MLRVIVRGSGDEGSKGAKQMEQNIRGIRLLVFLSHNRGMSLSIVKPKEATIRSQAIHT